MWYIYSLAFWLSLLVSRTISHRSDGYSWYSTIGEMKKLVVVDSKLLDLVRKRIVTEKSRVADLHARLKRIRGIQEDFILRYDKYRQSTADNTLYKKYQTYLNLTRNPSIFDKFLSILKRFPQDEDMISVMNALVNLQTSYKLNSSELAEGYIFGKYVGARLSADSCLYMANINCENRNLKLCKEWADIAYSRIDNGEAHETSRDEIDTMVGDAETDKLFKELCSLSVSDNYVEDFASEKLKCYLWNNFRHPWLVLQPVAMEVMSQSPDVAVFYDLLSDHDITHLKSASTPKLAKAKTVDDEESFEVDSYRVAHNCWLSRKNDSVISKIDQLVGAITGLQIRKTSEQLQVANYGIGGHYNAHTDPMPHTQEEEHKERNRKATFMFYLTDVEHGGSTVFLHPKIGVKPVKGGAVFWHNLLPSGYSDERTLHGSCPVVLGNKWVANKWIWETNTEMCKTEEYIGRLQ